MWKMKKWLILFIMILPLTMGAICEDRLDNATDCLMLTPTLDCSTYTYNITLRNGTQTATESTLTQLDGTKYYFNFTNTTGDYIITLCDGSTREFRVTETYDTKFEQEEHARMYIAAIVGLTFTAIFFIYLAWHFRNDYDDMGDYRPWIAPMRFLFIGLAVYTTMGIMRIGVDLLDEAGQSGMSSIANSLWIIFITIFSLVFFIIMFLYGIRFMMNFIKNIKYGEGGEDEFGGEHG